MNTIERAAGAARRAGRFQTLSAILCGSLLCATTALAAEQGETGDEGAQAGMQKTLPAPYRLSTWIGKAVQNADGEKLGEVREVVMDDYGVVRYVILQRPEAGEEGEQLVAVPLGHFNYRPGKSPELMIDVAAAHMQAAPAFAESVWPNMGDPRWNALVITYWVSPEAAGRMEQAAEAGGTQNYDANRDMVYLSEEKEALFSELDEDKDAAIEPEEARQHDRLAKEFDQVDTYANDRITRSEFAAFEPRMEEQ